MFSLADNFVFLFRDILDLERDAAKRKVLGEQLGIFLKALWLQLCMYRILYKHHWSADDLKTLPALRKEALALLAACLSANSRLVRPLFAMSCRSRPR